MTKTEPFGIDRFASLKHASSYLDCDYPGRAEFIKHVMKFAHELRKEAGGLGTIIVHSDIGGWNRYFTLRLEVPFRIVDGKVYAMLTPKVSEQVKDLDRQAKMFLN